SKSIGEAATSEVLHADIRVSVVQLPGAVHLHDVVVLRLNQCLGLGMNVSDRPPKLGRVKNLDGAPASCRSVIGEPDRPEEAGAQGAMKNVRVTQAGNSAT